MTKYESHSVAALSLSLVRAPCCRRAAVCAACLSKEGCFAHEAEGGGGGSNHVGLPPDGVLLCLSYGAAPHPPFFVSPGVKRHHHTRKRRTEVV